MLCYFIKPINLDSNCNEINCDNKLLHLIIVVFELYFSVYSVRFLGGCQGSWPYTASMSWLCSVLKAVQIALIKLVIFCVMACPSLYHYQWMTENLQYRRIVWFTEKTDLLTPPWKIKRQTVAPGDWCLKPGDFTKHLVCQIKPTFYLKKNIHNSTLICFMLFTCVQDFCMFEFVLWYDHNLQLGSTRTKSFVVNDFNLTLAFVQFWTYLQFLVHSYTKHL